jgi:hypothetical protein
MRKGTTGRVLARKIKGEMERVQYQDGDQGFFNPFSTLVGNLCQVRLHKADGFKRPKGDALRIALISMPEFPFLVEEFSSLRTKRSPSGIERHSCTRRLVAFRGDVPQRMLAAFEEALKRAVEGLHAHVVCISELGLPSLRMMPMQEATKVAYHVSQRGVLVIAGSAHDSRTLFNSGYMFYPGCPKAGVSFHKSVSAISAGELICSPSARHVPCVDIFGLKIATMLCLDIADYAALASVVRVGDSVDIVLVPCYTKKFEKMVEVARTASKALPGIVALVNAGLGDSVASTSHIAAFGRLEPPSRGEKLDSGVTISLFKLDHKEFHAERTRLKTSPDSQMEWLFGSRDRPLVFT